MFDIILLLMFVDIGVVVLCLLVQNIQIYL